MFLPTFFLILIAAFIVSIKVYEKNTFILQEQREGVFVFSVSMYFEDL